MKKYLASYVIKVIIEGLVNKLQQCLKIAITFATIPSQITRFHYFFAFETKLTCLFLCWFVTLVDKILVKFVIAYQ